MDRVAFCVFYDEQTGQMRGQAGVAIGDPLCEYVIQPAGQNNAWHELGNMSIENASVISSYVGLVWAIAWAFRAIRSSISTFESDQND